MKFEIVRVDITGEEYVWAETDYEVKAEITTKCLNAGTKLGRFFYRTRKNES